MRHALCLASFIVMGLATAFASGTATADAPPAAASGSQVDVTKLGAPAYPGAILDADYGPNKYKLEAGHSDAHYITQDSLAKVAAFYKAHMPANSAKPAMDPKTEAKFEIGNFGDDNYTGVTLMVETDMDGKPTGTQINVVHYWAQK